MVEVALQKFGYPSLFIRSNLSPTARPGTSYMIIHVDMDAYYASVEERDRPELAGQPVIVGGSSEQRGVVAAANYVARRFGVHSAMPTAAAKRLCPRGVFIPGRIDHYADVSQQIHEIFHRYTPLVEPLSLDEAFLDATGSEQLFGPAAAIAKRIKSEIHSELKLVASAGVAPNKFLAKIASDLDKPDGFVVVESGQVPQFLDSLPVGRIWGVGKQINKTMQRLGARTIGDLRRLPLELLESHFDSAGEHFWRLARGIDDRPVIPDREAKSISHETTFATDTDDADVLRGRLRDLTDQVARRLRRHDFRGSIVQVKVRFADFRTITRSQKLREPTNVTNELWLVVSEIFASRLPARRQPIRLLGMGVSGLDRSQLTQGLLFDSPQRQKQEQLDGVLDVVKDRFGTSALRRGSSLERAAKKKPGPGTGEYC